MWYEDTNSSDTGLSVSLDAICLTGHVCPERHQHGFFPTVRLLFCPQQKKYYKTQSSSAKTVSQVSLLSLYGKTIFTLLQENTEKKFWFKLNKEKHTLAWPAHLWHSFAARVDQKGNSGVSLKNDDLCQADRVKRSVWWPAAAEKPLQHMAKLWVTYLYLKTPKHLYDVRQPCHRGTTFKQTKVCIASLINIWCGGKFLNELFLGSWFQSAAHLASVLQFQSGFWLVFLVLCLLMKQEEASPKALTTFDGEESKEEGTQLRT